jgi:osmoprotectant transport system substrate-binding protein
MKRMTSAVALIAASLLGLTACGSSDDPLASSSPTGSASAGASGGPIVVGGANFSESTLLAEIYAGALKAKGIDATTKPNIGSREIYLRALEDNSVQVFPEYTGALAFNYDKAYTGTDPDEVYQHVQQVLPKTLTVLDKSAA